MVRTFAVVALLAGVTAATAGDPPASAIWNAEKTAAVTSLPAEAGTILKAYIQQQDETFLEIDLSEVENGNIGKLGHDRKKFERVETKPIKWISRQDDLLQVEIQTQAWRAGRRYTVSEPLIFRRSGTVLWR
ncbi:MAG: hypothetical protein Q4G39_07115 [Brachymonas sp.]|nr:hypothetical protein [Brachymonas sp.]